MKIIPPTLVSPSANVATAITLAAIAAIASAMNNLVLSCLMFFPYMMCMLLANVYYTNFLVQANDTILILVCQGGVSNFLV